MAEAYKEGVKHLYGLYEGMRASRKSGWTDDFENKWIRKMFNKVNINQGDFNTRGYDRYNLWFPFNKTIVPSDRLEEVKEIIKNYPGLKSTLAKFKVGGISVNQIEIYIESIIAIIKPKGIIISAHYLNGGPLVEEFGKKLFDATINNDLDYRTC